MRSSFTCKASTPGSTVDLSIAWRDKCCRDVSTRVWGAAQRVGIQLPQARWERLQNATDLAREAVSCNAGLGGNAEEWYALQA